MTDDLETFRAGLRAAGQPYSLWGARVVGAGLVFLIGAQVLSAYAMVLLALALVVMSTGWIMLIIAAVRRQRWAKAQALREPSLPPLP